MKKKTFESELPKGYTIAKVFDAKNKKSVIVMNVVALLLMIICVAVLLIPVFLNADRLGSDGYTFFLWLYFLLAYLVYIVGHELVHGIAYKALTKEKLTFGISLSCAFCGVPKIYTYRKTALIAVLAPFVAFSIAFIPLMILAFYSNIYIYIMVALVFACHFGGCVGDFYVAYLLLIKYKREDTLMNDTGPKMTIYVYDENLAEGESIQTESIAEVESDNLTTL